MTYSPPRCRLQAREATVTRDRSLGIVDRDREIAAVCGGLDIVDLQAAGPEQRFKGQGLEFRLRAQADNGHCAGIYASKIFRGKR